MVEDRNGCYLLRLRSISIPPVPSFLALHVAHTIPLVYFSSPRHSSSSTSLLIQLSSNVHVVLPLFLSLSLSLSLFLFFNTLSKFYSFVAFFIIHSALIHFIVLPLCFFPSFIILFQFLFPLPVSVSFCS